MNKVNKKKNFIKILFFISKLIIFCTLFIAFFTYNSFAEELKLNNVEYDPFGKTVNVKTSGKINPEITHIENPERLVLDFKNTIYPNVSRKIDVNDGYIKQIRISQFSTDPLISRISIELTKKIDFEFRTQFNNNNQVFQVTALEFENKPPINISNKTLDELKAKEITKVKKNFLDTLEIGEDQISLSGKEKTQIDFEISKLDEENTFSVKLFNFSANGLKDIPLRPNKIEKVEVIEDGTNTILKFKVQPKLKISVKKIENNKLELFPTEDVRELRNDNLLTLEFDESDKLSKLFISTSKKELSYSVFTLANPNRLVIDTFGTEIPSDRELTIEKNSKLIDKVRFGFLNKTQDNEEGIRIVVDLKKKVSFKEEMFGKNRTLELKLYDEFMDVPVGKGKYLVVLDAGHGGNDPGALGAKGYREKDVTLSIVYYLREMLVESGVSVILARGDDSEILLQPRVDIANNNKADIFVSVHCNAMDNSSPKGIETYYRTPQSSGLAQVMHKNMIGSLPTLDRGIRVRNFFVIRKTLMPSVLMEVGYLTNPSEGTLLGSKNYQKQVAKALYKGIREYLSKQNKI